MIDGTWSTFHWAWVVAVFAAIAGVIHLVQKYTDEPDDPSAAAGGLEITEQATRAEYRQRLLAVLIRIRDNRPPGV